MFPCSVPAVLLHHRTISSLLRTHAPAHTRASPIRMQCVQPGVHEEHQVLRRPGDGMLIQRPVHKTNLTFLLYACKSACTLHYITLHYITLSSSEGITSRFSSSERKNTCL
jgi:hypothetical protein